MIEGGYGFGFPLKAHETLWGCHLGGEDLQGDFATKLGVLGDVDISHTAGAKERYDLKGAEF
jgi:hypothetical protein